MRNVAAKAGDEVAGDHEVTGDRVVGMQHNVGATGEEPGGHESRVSPPAEVNHRGSGYQRWTEAMVVVKSLAACPSTPQAGLDDTFSAGVQELTGSIGAKQRR